MPGKVRVIVLNCPQHIVQRGHNCKVISVMKTLVSITLSMLLATPAFAGYATGNVGRMWSQSNGWVYVGIVPAPPSTCNYYLVQLKFDGSTAAGKSMLSILEAAKISGKTTDVWYSDSPTPGSDQNSGCTDATLSIPSGIGIPQ